MLILAASVDLRLDANIGVLLTRHGKVYYIGSGDVLDLPVYTQPVYSITILYTFWQNFFIYLSRMPPSGRSLSSSRNPLSR